MLLTTFSLLLVSLDTHKLVRALANEAAAQIGLKSSSLY